MLKYSDDPAGFGSDILHETYTPDIIKVLESIRDNQVTLVKSANGVGKTHCAGAAAVWWYKCHQGAQVWTAAAPPERNLEQLLWGEIGSRVEKNKELFSNDTLKYLTITRAKQEFVAGVTIPQSGNSATRKASFSGKHAPYLLFLIDEGDAVPPDVYEAIESCMSGGIKARMAIFFNPRAEVGPLYMMERDKRAVVVELSAFTHPNVVTGENIYPGAVTRETTVRRINEWTRPLMNDEKVDGECFTIPKPLIGTVANSFQGTPYPPLEDQWRKIINPSFSVMVLGQYPGQSEAQLIASQWLYDARARWDAYVAIHGENPPFGTRGVMGVDVAEFGNDWTCVCLKYGGFVQRLIQWQGVDTLVSGRRAAGIYKEKKCYQAKVDGIGVGAGVWPVMQDEGCYDVMRVMSSGAVTESVEMGTFGTLRDQITWACREWLRTDPGAMLPPDDWLLEELRAYKYAVNTHGKLKVSDKDTLKEILGRSPDRAESLIITFADAETGTSVQYDTFKGNGEEFKTEFARYSNR